MCERVWVCVCVRERERERERAKERERKRERERESRGTPSLQQKSEFRRRTNKKLKIVFQKKIFSEKNVKFEIFC